MIIIFFKYNNQSHIKGFSFVKRNLFFMKCKHLHLFTNFLNTTEKKNEGKKKTNKIHKNAENKIGIH